MFTPSDIRKLARIEEGVPLWGCAPGSPAALAGLRYGDIVLSVDGKRTRTAEEYVAAKGSEDVRHEIVFRRGADLLTTVIEPGPALWPDTANDMAELVGPDSFWMLQTRRAPKWRN